MADHRFLNTILGAADVNRSRAFFEGVLGLKPRFQDGERWLQFDVGGVVLALSGPAETAAAGIGNAAVTLEVPDLGGEIARLARAGVAASAIRDMGSHGRSAVVRDPDGNSIVLFQRAPKAG